MGTLHRKPQTTAPVKKRTRKRGRARALLPQIPSLTEETVEKCARQLDIALTIVNDHICDVKGCRNNRSSGFKFADEHSAISHFRLKHPKHALFVRLARQMRNYNVSVEQIRVHHIQSAVRGQAIDLKPIA